MHDIKLIREAPEVFDKAMQLRGLEPLSHEIILLDEEIRRATQQIQSLQAKRNEIAKKVPQYKSKGEDIQLLLDESEVIKEKILQEEQRIEEDKNKLHNYLISLPNIPASDVPFGKDENSNKELRKVGEIRKFDFTAQEHFILGEQLNVMDFEQAAKMSGARFVTLKGKLARLERALMNFMLDINTQKFGYKEIVPPNLVKPQAIFNVGQLPKFEEDLFKTTNDYYLISTSEVSLTNLVADKIIAEEELPLRFTSYTQCFRSEAGSAGKDTRGMIRMHQFAKVELVSVVSEQESVAEHERMVGIAEEILKQLGLPYRVMLLCSQDMGFCALKTYDIEVWLPGQNRYREISSCSNCGNFQARRMRARYKKFKDNKNFPVHTLNGSALPLGRTIIAIMENYQNEDGTISIPKVLLPYMNGITKIEKE